MWALLHASAKWLQVYGLHHIRYTAQDWRSVSYTHLQVSGSARGFARIFSPGFSLAHNVFLHRPLRPRDISGCCVWQLKYCNRLHGLIVFHGCPIFSCFLLRKFTVHTSNITIRNLHLTFTLTDFTQLTIDKIQYNWVFSERMSQRFHQKSDRLTAFFADWTAFF